MSRVGLLTCLLAGLWSVGHASATDFDLVLAGGTVVDGTGADRFRADVGLYDGRITAIGDLSISTAREVIDVTGLIVAPGFIDTHSHADVALNDTRSAGIEGFLKQGVTTAVYGVDGFLGVENLKRYAELGEAGGMGINFMSYVGHNAVRRAVMGEESRPASEAELEQMKEIVRDGMAFGAIGLSTGLMYLPGRFATTEEVVELARVTAPYGGLYDSHVRDPANNLLQSHQECLDIALAAGVDAHPGHIKAVGGKNFGKGDDLVELVEAGIARGQNVTVDLYPYDGAATAPVVGILIPGNDDVGKVLGERVVRLFAGTTEDEDVPGLINELAAYWGSMDASSDAYAAAKRATESPPDGVFSWVATAGYESLRIVVSGQDGHEGRMVTDLADELGISPFELLRQIVAEEGAAAMVTLGAIQEEDFRVILKQPWAMISSDGQELDPQHPRSRGTFPRVLGRYVREWGVLSLEEAIHKMTGLPARYLKMKDRGLIREGSVADIVVFDPDTVIDKATWAEPGLYSEGITHVLVGGELALRSGEVTDKRLGKFIPFRNVQFDDDLVPRLDDLISEIMPWTDAAPAYSIVVDHRGKTVYERYEGYADIGNRVPASRDTTFKIGSISKSYTALAVLQLVENGDVDLDATVATYLPELEQPSADVTIRQLLTHTSGIPNYTDLSETRPLLEWSEPEREDIVDLFQDKALEFEPGTRYNYSNSGYYLLGLVIEAVSRMDYFDYLASNILEPLDLDATYSGDYHDIVPNQARGYVVTPDGFKVAAPTSHLAPFSAGMLEATAADVAKYRRGVLKSSVFSQRLRDLVTTTGKFEDGTDEFYSFGALTISEVEGHRRLEHNGGITGFVSEHVYYPDQDLTIVVLLNALGAPVSPEKVAAKLFGAIFDVEELDATETRVPTEVLESYIGLYRLSPFWLAGEFKRVLLEDGALVLQLNPGSEEPVKIPLLPRSQTEFALAVNEGIRIRFRIDNEQVTGLEVHTSGRAMPAKRVAE